MRILINTEVRAREVLTNASCKEEGAGIVEYLLLVLFIALVLIVSLVFFSDQIAAGFSRAGNSIPS